MGPSEPGRGHAARAGCQAEGSRASDPRASLLSNKGAPPSASGPAAPPPVPYLLPRRAPPGSGRRAQAPGQSALGRRWGPGRSREALRPALPQAGRHERAGQRPRARGGAPRPAARGCAPGPLCPPQPAPFPTGPSPPSRVRAAPSSRNFSGPRPAPPLRAAPRAPGLGSRLTRRRRRRRRGAGPAGSRCSVSLLVRAPGPL